MIIQKKESEWSAIAKFVIALDILPLTFPDLKLKIIIRTMFWVWVGVRAGVSVLAMLTPGS